MEYPLDPPTELKTLKWALKKMRKKGHMHQECYDAAAFVIDERIKQLKKGGK